MVSHPGSSRRLERHRIAVRRLITGVVDFAERIALSLNAGGGGAIWTRDVPARESSFAPLRALDVDGLATSGLVDLTLSLPDAVQHMFFQPSLLFPHSSREQASIPCVRDGDKA